MKYYPKKLSQAGFTLTELMASLLIAGVIFAAAAIAMSAFFSKFEDMSAYADLQAQAFDCLANSIKYGMQIKNENNEKEWYGVADSDSMQFVGTSTSSGTTALRLFTQVLGPNHIGDYVQYELRNHAVYAGYKHGSQQVARIQIFPKPTRKGSKITVTDLRFQPVKIYDSDKRVNVVRVTLDAKVLVRKEYIPLLHAYVPIYKYVHYTTKMTTVIHS